MTTAAYPRHPGWAVGLIAALGLLAGGAGPADGPPAAVTIPGRVVELGTGKPVAGAEVAIAVGPRPERAERDDRMTAAPTARADADGRFALTFAAEQAADPTIQVVVLRIAHPDFVPRGDRAGSLADLVATFRLTGRTYLDEIALERGVAYTARVLNPDGTPAAGVPATCLNRSSELTRPPDHFVDLFEGQADADGRLRLRMPQLRSLRLTLTPGQVAPYQHWWGWTFTGADDPNATVPADLGTIRLEPGAIVAGRLLDERGRPVAGQGLTIEGRFNRATRAATTDAEGRFAFAPLAPGNYTVRGLGQEPGNDLDKPMLVPGAAIIRPRPIFFAAGETPPPLELRAAATVRVSARLVDSAGHPARGGRVSLGGGLFIAPEDASTAPLTGPPAPPYGPERWSTDDQYAWGADLVSDATGVVEFRAPANLRDAELVARDDPTHVYRARPGPGAPLNLRGRVQLGLLEADRAGIEFVQLLAPAVIARISTEDGEPVPAQVRVDALYDRDGGSYVSSLGRQPDGRYRSVGLLPDFEYEFSAEAPGYVPQAIQRLVLAEGATAEIELFLRKRPPRPAIGDPAPPFAVVTVDGQPRSLADYRGRFLLIHIWSPLLGGNADLARVDALARRHGDRLAVLGLVLSADVDAARRAIAAANPAGPQAILRDRMADPLVQDFGAADPPTSLLIGPDGTILNRHVVGADVDRAVTRVLGGK